MTHDAIVIRHAASSDAECLQKIYSDLSVIAGTLQLPFPPLELWKKRLESPPQNSFGLVACRGSAVLGHLGMQTRENPRQRHVATFGIAVIPEERRSGIASALVKAAIDLAERWLAIRRLELEVYTDNEAAIALYKKFGFTVEGTLAQYAFRDGEFVDAYKMARVRK